MNREQLIACVDDSTRAAPDFLFFWGHHARSPFVGKECLSQWYPSPFVVGEETLPTAEHYMMVAKARLFGDEVAASAMLATVDPAEVKKLGRMVVGFEAGKWEKAGYDIVVAGNLAKFKRHRVLREYLLSTGDKVLVEASPSDKIWGIGLSEQSELAEDPRHWRGENLLGFALMEVRDRLRADGLTAATLIQYK
jgi:ribA/ribD-fused uncharacterized protein